MSGNIGANPQGYHLMETLRRMTIFVIGTLGVLNLVLMEGDY